MVTVIRRQRLNLPIAPLVAVLIGVFTALVFTLMPDGMLEDFAIDSGIAAVVPAAEPPLGDTARAVLIMVGGGGAALIAWFALFLIIGARAIVIQRSSDPYGENMPVLRRADAHPDAPARRPLFANRELGTPFLEVRAGRPVHLTADMPEAPAETGPKTEAVEAEPAVERTLPADLDTPLAAFDPQAIPDKPIDWFEQRVPLLRTPRQQVFDAGERFETFDLSPMRRSAPAPFAPRGPLSSAPAPSSPAAPAPAPAPAPTSPAPVVSEAPAPAAPAPAAPVFESPRARASARVEMDPSASIHALLDRLERGVGRREMALPPPPPPQPQLRPRRDDNLEDTLVALRRLATAAR